MQIMSVKDLSKAYGTDIIFEDVCFGVDKGDRIGIVGPNGSGKSTLLGIIAGLIDPGSGDIYIRSGYSLAYLKQQNQFSGNGTVIEEAEKSFTHLYEIEKRIAELQDAISDHGSDSFEKDISEFTALNERYEELGGYTYKSELAATLTHMGFSDDDRSKTIDMLSGGERTRLALSCILLRKPDILMLDEPTNHLDLNMLKWLENYLDSYRGTIIVVSHDRYFLDRVCNRIFDLSDGTLDTYKGNYSDFIIKRRERYETLLREYEKQQAEIARQEEMIRRFKQHGTEHLTKRARSREKRLAMIEAIDRPLLKQDKIKLSFDADYKSGNEVLEIEGLSKSYGDRQLFRDANLLVRKSEKICIIGENGIGKTTLIRILLGLERADDGYLRTGYNVNFGYYDQGQLLLDNNETVLGEMKNAYHLYTDTEMRSLLGRFLFRGDDVFKRVGDLSGGEKARLALLKLMLSGANTLVLDEPTNHLDIESKEIVEKALLEFGGTLIIVSHDRYLLNRIPDRILELKQGGLVEYKGKFDYYLEKTSQGALQEESQNAGAETHRSPDIAEGSEARRQEKKQKEAENRRRARRADETEDKIHALESMISELQDEIMDHADAGDPEWMRTKSEELAKMEAEVNALYDEWMELQ